ncbi:MAG: TlpA disulfide reductase family protein [Saprospiraceae bacterium]
MYFKNYLLLLFGFIVTGCAKQYPISGKLMCTDENSKYRMYLIDPQEFDAVLSSYLGKVIDSAHVESGGRFYFNLNTLPKEDALLFVAVQPWDEKFPNKLNTDDLKEANFLPVIFNNKENIYITANADSVLHSASMKNPSAKNRAVLDFVKEYFNLLDKFDNFTSNVDEHSLIEKESNEFQLKKQIVESTLYQQDFTLTALAIRFAAPNGDYERIAEIIKNTCTTFQGNANGNPMYNQLCSKSKNLPLVPGDTFPVMQLPMLDGGEKSTSELWNNDLTLFDFWATWCAPCRKENTTTLVPLWTKENQNGFQIVGYALDSSENGWKNAIKKDGVDKWPHASHLQGDESPLFDALHIITIPSNYLVNKEGIIVAKNLHGETLRRFVTEYLNKKDKG